MQWIDLLEQVIQEVWESEALQDWRDTLLVSQSKKESKSDCGNFRGISLLSILGKVFSRNILERLIGAIVNSIHPELKCGFHTNCGTVDMIFSARQLQKKWREQNLLLYHVSLTYQKRLITWIDWLSGRFCWIWVIARNLWVWFDLFMTAFYDEISVDNDPIINRVTFMHPKYFVSTSE